MATWMPHKHGTGADLRLGHGLRCSVHYEASERLPPGSPKYNVTVFGERVGGRVEDFEQAKARAEEVARAWLTDALAAI